MRLMKVCLTAVSAMAALAGGARSAPPSVDAMRHSFLAAVESCKAAVRASPTRRNFPGPGGQWGASAVLSAEVTGADAVTTASIVAPLAGWVRVQVSTSVLTNLANEEAAAAADPASSKSMISEGTYTLRLSSDGGRWVVVGADAATRLLKDGEESKYSRASFSQSAADVKKSTFLPQAACANAIDAAK